MITNRIFKITTIIYILGILTLPWLIPHGTINHIWNPYSLLHIPFYGVLMGLLTFAFLPNLFNSEGSSLRPFSLLLPGGVATLVGILDEVNQVFIPYRDASVGDLLLNLTGTVLSGLAIYSWQRRKRRMTS
jgi:VanZ family protein